MTEERSSPTKEMLPAFRVKQARLPEGDAVVRMKKADYDELLKREPNAALRYIDESDGEVILVGSSLELDQRLSEPVEGASKTHAGIPLDLYGKGRAPMHSFHIEKEEAVLEAWAELDVRTIEEGLKAQRLFFGKQHIATIQPQQHSVARATVAKAPPPPPQRTKDVRFGQPSPPRSSLNAVKPPTQLSHEGVVEHSAAADRWASYSNLPSFDQLVLPSWAELCKQTEAIGVGKGQTPGPQNDKPTKSAFDVMADAALGQHVRTHTVQVPSSPQQKQEHQPLLEMFWKPQTAQNISKPSHLMEEEHQPLLDLFKGQLNQLGSHPEHPKPRSEPSPRLPQADAKAVAEDSPSSGVHPAPSNDAIHMQTPGDLLTMSIQSLLHGVGQLASAFKLTNSELQQQVAIAQRDFPNNVEKALRVSLSAIDSLRSGVSAAKSPVASKHSDQGTQASKPATTDRATLTSESGNAVTGPENDETVAEYIKTGRDHSQRELDWEEAKLQSDRVETAIERMRLELLEMGWHTSSSDRRIYTRADILETFLRKFQRLRSMTGPSPNLFEEKILEVPSAGQEYQQAYVELVAPLLPMKGPPVPAKLVEVTKEPATGFRLPLIKDDDAPMFDNPYSWDVDYRAAREWKVPETYVATASESQLEDTHTAGECGWTPLIPSKTRPYRFEPEAVLEARISPGTTSVEIDGVKRVYRRDSDGMFRLISDPLGLPSDMHSFRAGDEETAQALLQPRQPAANQQMSELADEEVLERYPTISQFERRGLQSGSMLSLSGAFPDSQARGAKVREPQSKTLPLHPRPATSRLSARKSMPVLSEAKPTASTKKEWMPPHGFDGYEGTSDFTQLHDLYESSKSLKHTISLRDTRPKKRSDTTAGTRAPVHSSHRAASYTPYEPAKYRPAGTSSEVKPSTPKIEECRKRLVEMGFEASHSANLSRVVEGDLSEAIDILEEDVSARKAWKGKGRATDVTERKRHMPGAFDDEIYG